MKILKRLFRRAAWDHFAALTLTAALGATLSLTPDRASAADPDDPLKITFIFNYSAIDGGWNESFVNSQAYLQEKFGDKIEVEYKENVPEGPQARRIIEAAIQNGTDLLISTSYGYGETFLQAAASNPDVYFLASQWDSSDNLSNFAGFINAPEDGSYIAGVAAGHIMKQGGKAGWVDAFPIPYDIRTINGFALGLAHSNPTAMMQVVFTNSWSDANLQARAARSLIDAGSDFIGTSISGPAVAEAAETAKIPVVTPALDGRRYAPDNLVTSYEYLWGSALSGVVESILAKNFTNDFIYAGMKIGAVDMSPWGGAYDGLSDEAKADIQAEYDKIRSGGAVFTGPLVDKAGNQVLAEGETMSIEALQNMNFVLPNVNGVEF